MSKSKMTSRPVHPDEKIEFITRAAQRMLDNLELGRDIRNFIKRKCTESKLPDDVCERIIAEVL
jgi:hypothetical protein